MSNSVMLHILQNLPPGCWVRDDNNEPKTFRTPGSVRHYLSSQSQKKAIRSHPFLNKTKKDETWNTRNISKLIYKKLEENLDINNIDNKDIIKQNVTLEEIDNILKRVKINNVMIYIGSPEIEAIVNVIISKFTMKDGVYDSSNITKNEIEDIIKKECHTINQSLFGRMIAEIADAKIDGAVQTGIAFSTHNSPLEFDFFTAVDDFNDSNQGSGHMGYQPFVSSCIYKCYNLDLMLLENNLVNNQYNIKDIAKDFLMAAIVSQSGSKQNSMFSPVYPDFILIEKYKDGSPISLANAFETPVVADNNGSIVVPSINKLLNYRDRINKGYPLHFNNISNFSIFSTFQKEELNINEKYTIKDNIEEMIDEIIKDI